MEFVSSVWKHLWYTWDLRVAVLFSAFLQIFLIFSAPLRKRTSSAYVLVPIWFAYLLADAIAIFAAGFISIGQGGNSSPFANPDLVAFWASFLFVHLGGPDTITAFAPEDNELWLRHLLRLGFPCWAVVYALILSFPTKELLVPTVLIFVAGLIKNIERALSLYLATSRTVKDSPPIRLDLGPDYAEFMDEYTEARSPVTVEMVPARRPDEIDKPGELTDLMVLQYAYRLFNTFRGLTADLLFSSQDCKVSRCFFLKRTPADAFKVVEVELNFLYDILYTKATVVQGMLGYLVRMLLLSLDCTSIALFYRVGKKEFTNFDTGLTYTLLVGALALDLTASIMVLKSDWTLVALAKVEHPRRGIAILKMLLKVEKERWPKNHGKRPRCFSKPHRRWSGSLSQYNMINYCLRPRPKGWEKTIGIFRLNNILDGMKYVQTVEFSNDLGDFIFKELKMKSTIANDLKTANEIYEARGNWILGNENCTEFLRWTNKVDFDESLLLWHIATELCFNIDVSSTCTNIGSPTVTNPNSACNKTVRELSKYLSDYMLYLLIMQSSMISTSAGGVQIRFADTCAEAKKFFKSRKIRKVQIQACKSILEVNIEISPDIMGDRRFHNRFVLFDACVLTKELLKLESERMWQIISKVWVEMLSYAACHCRANIHAAHLSKGGNLITLVWLLNCHLGLGNKSTPGLRFASNELN